MNLSLQTPIKIGPYLLPNRIVMAPLTRMRAPDNIPTDLMAAYYAQRASAEESMANQRGQTRLIYGF